MRIGELDQHCGNCKCVTGYEGRRKSGRMEQARRTQLDAAKVFAAIAAILSRRDGRRVQVVSVKKIAEDDEVQKKAG